MKGYRLDLFLGVIGLLMGYLYDRSLGTAIVFAGSAMLISSTGVLVILLIVLTMQTVQGLQRGAAKTKLTLSYLVKQRDVHLCLLFVIAPIVGASMIFASSHMGGALDDVNLMYFCIGLLITIIMNVVSPPQLTVRTPFR